jgi:lysophospholipase L1-like esterase
MKRTPYLITKNKEDTIRIAYIGDSWAFMHREHNCQIAKLLSEEIKHPVKVHSYGICGLTSKEIYENMFDNADFKQFLQKRKYSYCFVSAGINDSYKKMSTSYYQQSMNYIIQFLLSNNIHPIILEIPDYDIEKSFERQKLSRKVLRYLSMFVNGTPIDCKQSFRDALNQMIQREGYTNKISVIQYQIWNVHGDKDLSTLYKKDGMHLNDYGYTSLDTIIVKNIIKHHYHQ